MSKILVTPMLSRVPGGSIHCMGSCSEGVRCKVLSLKPFCNHHIQTWYNLPESERKAMNSEINSDSSRWSTYWEVKETERLTRKVGARLDKVGYEILIQPSSFPRKSEGSKVWLSEQEKREEEYTKFLMGEGEQCTDLVLPEYEYYYAS